MQITYRISNLDSGLELGIYEGTSEDAALLAMVKDAGYRSRQAWEDVVGSDHSDLLIVEVHEVATAG